MESLTRSASRPLTDPAPNRTYRSALRPAGILGLGAYAPQRVLTNEDLEKIVDTSHEWIVSRTGIVERRVAAPDEKTSDLAYHAAIAALEDARVDPAEVDLILVATVTPDAPFPATACILQHRLGASRAAAMDVSAACSGFTYGLATAAQFIQTGLYRRILVVGAETLSRITNWRDRSTCVLFGDGAGAAVVGPVEGGSGFLSFDLGSDGAGGPLLAVQPGGWGHPLSTGTEEGLVQSIQMAGGEVFKFAVRVMEDSTRRAAESAGIRVDEIDCLIPHQANIRIIDAAAKRLEMDESRIFSNVQRYGNTSAASIPLALCEARDARRLRPGDTVALVGFGAGLTWASCILKWTDSEGRA